MHRTTIRPAPTSSAEEQQTFRLTKDCEYLLVAENTNILVSYTDLLDGVQLSLQKSQTVKGLSLGVLLDNQKKEKYAGYHGYFNQNFMGKQSVYCLQMTEMSDGLGCCFNKVQKLYFDKTNKSEFEKHLHVSVYPTIPMTVDEFLQRLKDSQWVDCSELFPSVAVDTTAQKSSSTSTSSSTVPTADAPLSQRLPNYGSPMFEDDAKDRLVFVNSNVEGLYTALRLLSGIYNEGTNIDTFVKELISYLRSNAGSDGDELLENKWFAVNALIVIIEFKTMYDNILEDPYHSMSQKLNDLQGWVEESSQLENVVLIDVTDRVESVSSECVVRTSTYVVMLNYIVS